MDLLDFCPPLCFTRKLFTTPFGIFFKFQVSTRIDILISARQFNYSLLLANSAYKPLIWPVPSTEPSHWKTIVDNLEGNQVYLSLSVCLSVCLFVCLSVYVSVCLSVKLFVKLSGRTRG